MEGAAIAHCSHPECGLVPFNLPPTWPCGVCVCVFVSLYVCMCVYLCVCVCVCVDSLPYVACVYVFCINILYNINNGGGGGGGAHR